MEGDDYNLWCLYSDGGAWRWLNLGKPSAANLKLGLGVVSVMDTPTAPQRTHLFTLGNDDNVWVDWWG
jgi:hypothetical protein